MMIQVHVMIVMIAVRFAVDLTQPTVFNVRQDMLMVTQNASNVRRIATIVPFLHA